jgi:hypothetical protein
MDDEDEQPGILFTMEDMAAIDSCAGTSGALLIPNVTRIVPSQYFQDLDNQHKRQNKVIKAIPMGIVQTSSNEAFGKFQVSSYREQPSSKGGFKSNVTSKSYITMVFFADVMTKSNPQCFALISDAEHSDDNTFSIYKQHTSQQMMGRACYILEPEVDTDTIGGIILLIRTPWPIVPEEPGPSHDRLPVVPFREPEQGEQRF